MLHVFLWCEEWSENEKFNLGINKLTPGENLPYQPKIKTRSFDFLFTPNLFAIIKLWGKSKQVLRTDWKIHPDRFSRYLIN